MCIVATWNSVTSVSAIRVVSCPNRTRAGATVWSGSGARLSKVSFLSLVTTFLVWLVVTQNRHQSNPCQRPCTSSEDGGARRWTGSWSSASESCLHQQLPASQQAFSVAVSMNSIRQIAIQLPEGLQRLQLHLFANGLVGWSPEANSDESEVQSADQTPQTASPQVNLRHAFDRLHVSASEADSTNDEDDFADVESDAGSDTATDNMHQQSPQGMTDEEQIAAVQAFIVGDDTLNPTLQEAAWMAATQLVSSLADSSEYLEPEVISTLQELCVHLHAVDGGLQLKIGHGIMARSIYIYGDDETSDNDDHYHSYEHDTEDDEDAMHGSTSSRSVVTGDVASEEGVACPVCLSTYSSNVRMAALGCHHHVCNRCFRRLSRPRTCPICRAYVSSHVEVIM